MTVKHYHPGQFTDADARALDFQIVNITTHPPVEHLGPRTALYAGDAAELMLESSGFREGYPNPLEVVAFNEIATVEVIATCHNS